MNALWQVWLQTARRHPDRVMISEAESGHTLTCAQLTTAAVQRAATLPRGVIPFALPNSADWFVQFLAIQHRGGIAVPLEAGRQLPALPARRGIRLIKTTSGTTGQFQPIHCTAANLLADGRHVCATMGIKPTDINLALIPLGHSYGLGNLVMPLIQQGTPVICAAAFMPRQILQFIERYRVTVFPTVPAVLRALVQLPHPPRPAGLRLVISAGAPLPPELARQFHETFGVRVHNFYGASETGGICYDRTGRGRGVGQPLRGVRVTLRKDGRVTVASRAVVGTGRFVLADRGEWSPRGDLLLTGRVGVVANIGGKKVAPAEIESALRQLPGVSDAWVTVLVDARGNDVLAAAVETRQTRAVVEAALARRLPLWQLPKRLFLAAQLPRTGRSKLDTGGLRARLEPTAPPLR